MGVYPLLADDTCWLLAIDLDGGSWRTDVAALREACGELGVLPAVERSRSGDGAHVWFFFSAPVPAALARRFGMMLLTDAMGRCSTLGMASYDRLFPSQDTLPKGGFGNLIALPLQHEARQHGNSLFLDEQLEPYEDQWSYLEALPRIEPSCLEDLVAQADAAGQRSGCCPGVDRQRGAVAPGSVALQQARRGGDAGCPQRDARAALVRAQRRTPRRSAGRDAQARDVLQPAVPGTPAAAASPPRAPRA